MPNSFRKRRIPVGSTFRVKVTQESQGGAFDASGHYQPAAGADQNWTHQQLLNGLVRQLNRADSYYRGDITLVFNTQSSARVRLEVRKPGRDPHGRVLSRVYSGTGNRLVRIYFSLKTVRQAQAGGA